MMQSFYKRIMYHYAVLKRLPAELFITSIQPSVKHFFLLSAIFQCSSYGLNKLALMHSQQMKGAELMVGWSVDLSYRTGDGDQKQRQPGTVDESGAACCMMDPRPMGLNMGMGVGAGHFPHLFLCLGSEIRGASLYAVGEPELTRDMDRMLVLSSNSSTTAASSGLGKSSVAKMLQTNHDE